MCGLNRSDPATGPAANGLNTLVGESFNSDSILRTEHLSRVVKDKALVQDATFEVRKGEVLAIVGPSGSGKTSLLRLLNRLDEPTVGTVYVDGVDYRTIEPRDLRRQLGMVTQRPYLFPGTGKNWCADVPISDKIPCMLVAKPPSEPASPSTSRRTP